MATAEQVIVSQAARIADLEGGNIQLQQQLMQAQHERDVALKDAELAKAPEAQPPEPFPGPLVEDTPTA